MCISLALPLPPVEVTKDYFGLEKSEDGGAQEVVREAGESLPQHMPPPRLPPPPMGKALITLTWRTNSLDVGLKRVVLSRKVKVPQYFVPNALVTVLNCIK